MLHTLAKNSWALARGLVAVYGTRACNKRNFEHEPRVPGAGQITFLLTTGMPVCYVGTKPLIREAIRYDNGPIESDAAESSRPEP